MNELTILDILGAIILPPIGIIGGIWGVIKIIEIIGDLMESKIEIVQKRVVSITIMGEDAKQIEKILQIFLAIDQEDRRLKGFAQRMLKRINEQRVQIRKIELEEQKEAMQQFFEMMDEEKDVIELTDVTNIESQEEDDEEKIEQMVKFPSNVG